MISSRKSFADVEQNEMCATNRGFEENSARYEEPSFFRKIDDLIGLNEDEDQIPQNQEEQQNSSRLEIAIADPKIHEMLCQTQQEDDQLKKECSNLQIKRGTNLQFSFLPFVLVLTKENNGLDQILFYEIQMKRNIDLLIDELDLDNQVSFKVSIHRFQSKFFSSFCSSFGEFSLYSVLRVTVPLIGHPHVIELRDRSNCLTGVDRL